MLINCVAYRDGRRLTDLALSEVGSVLHQPKGFVWVALRDADADELAQVQQVFDLPELAMEDVRHGRQRPKVEEFGALLYLVMHLLEPVEGGWREGEVHVFASPQFVVSLRSNSGRDFLGVRARCEREPQRLRLGPGYVLYALMDAVVDDYFPQLEALESELEAVEEQIFQGGEAARRSVERLYALKRRAGRLRHAVAPLAEVATACTAAACPRSASARRTTSATSTTTWRASTAPSTRCATPSPPPSRSTSRWSPSRSRRPPSAWPPGPPSLPSAPRWPASGA
jgi:magnesium transporter